MKFYFKSEMQFATHIRIFMSFRRLMTMEYENNRCEAKQLKDFFFIEYDEQQRQCIRFTDDITPEVFHLVWEVVKNLVIE